MHLFGTYNAFTAPAYVFNGTIDEVRVYNRSLTSEQVLALFNNRTDLIENQETTVQT